MKEAYDMAFRILQKTRRGGKAYCDRKTQSAVFVAGDRVPVMNVSEQGGPGKLPAYWEYWVHIHYVYMDKIF